MSNIPKFKSGWVYTYDKYGIISKRLIRAISLDPFYYQLTGDPNYRWKESEMFLRKKDCIAAMERAGVQQRTLEQATVSRLEEKLIDLQHRLDVAEIALKSMSADYLSKYCSDYCGDTGNCKNCEYEKRTSAKVYKEKAEKELKGE